jgi:PAS domain-containing protein
MQCVGTRTPRGIVLNRVIKNNGAADDDGTSAACIEHEHEALRASEERYRALFDLGPVAVYSCDAAGVIQQFNRCAAELWGREPTPGIPILRLV